MADPCYCAELRLATRRLTAHYDEALAPAGISLAQFSLLRRVSRYGPLSLTDLAKRMDLDRSTVGRNVRVVERLGFVRPAKRDDQREAALEISDRGRETLERAEPFWTDAQRRVEEKLGPAGVSALLVALAEL